MDRAYGTPIIGGHVQWVKTHCYKIFRADGSDKRLIHTNHDRTKN
jgi:hypothetical protein